MRMMRIKVDLRKSYEKITCKKRNQAGMAKNHHGFKIQSITIIFKNKIALKR
jgi:hypothetical protein